MIKAEELLLNNQEKTIEDVEKAEDKGPGIFERAKNLFSNKEVMNQVVKTGIESVASIAGIKSFYDVPAYFKQKFEVIKDKKDYNEIFSNLGNENISESDIEDKKVAEIVNLDQIDVVQNKIEGMGVSEEIKNKLTQELNGLIENYHNEMDTLKSGENEKLTETLDEYVKTKISGVQASKEALNTLFVASGAYGLRGLSYGALSVLERHQKLLQESNKEGEEVDFMKDVIISGAKETFQELAFKGEGTKTQKTLKAIKSFGSLARFAGIADTTLSAPENYDKAIDKLLDTLDGDTGWGEAGQNFVQNIESKVPFAGGIEEAEAGEADITENMTERQLKNFNTFKKWAKEMGAEDVYTDRELARMEILGGREDIAHENFEDKTKLRLLGKFGKEIAQEGEMESWIDDEGLEHVKAVNKGVVYEYVTDKDGNVVSEDLSGRVEGAKWDYRNKKWTIGKTNIISPDSEGAKMLEDMGIVDSEESEGLPDSDQSDKIESTSQAVERMDTSFESKHFTSSGQEQLMAVMEKEAGPHAEEAYKQNMDLIRNEFNHYLSGKVTKENLENWCQGMNDKLKELGAESDVIDMNKLEGLKPNIISSPDVDKDAF